MVNNVSKRVRTCGGQASGCGCGCRHGCAPDPCHQATQTARAGGEGASGRCYGRAEGSESGCVSGCPWCAPTQRSNTAGRYDNGVRACVFYILTSLHDPSIPQVTVRIRGRFIIQVKGGPEPACNMESKHILRYQRLPTFEAKSRHRSSILLHNHDIHTVFSASFPRLCIGLLFDSTLADYWSVHPASTLDDKQYQLAPGNNLSTAHEHRVLRTLRRSHLTSFTRMYLPPRRVSSRVRIAVFMSSRDRYSTTPEGQQTREKHSKLG